MNRRGFLGILAGAAATKGVESSKAATLSDEMLRELDETTFLAPSRLLEYEPIEITWDPTSVEFEPQVIADEVTLGDFQVVHINGIPYHREILVNPDKKADIAPENRPKSQKIQR